MSFTTTRYPKSIMSADVPVRLLQPSKMNGKFASRNGNKRLSTWRVGAFKGMPLYSLTLVERMTCPSSCAMWDKCYGNRMPFANRINPFDNEDVFFTRLSIELDDLDRKYPNGYSIRLHVLGDFYSVDYVMFWESQLRNRKALHIYGYTHQTRSDIHDAIDDVYREYGTRFNILQSDGDDSEIRPIAVVDSESTLTICPEQSGKANGCLDCGLCTNNIKGVQFIEH